jgi:hypothetical protein
MSSFVSWTTWACLHPRCSIRQCQQTSRWACMSRQVVYIGMREYIGMQGSSMDQICRVKSQSDCVYLGRQGRMRAAHNVCGQGTSRMCVRLCWRDLLYREERGQAGVPTVYQGGGRAGGRQHAGRGSGSNSCNGDLLICMAWAGHLVTVQLQRHADHLIQAFRQGRVP